MKALGFERLNSSDLQTRGGITADDVLSLFAKVRLLIDFIGDYIPKLIKGIRDGLSGAPANSK